jgi:putative toxin-antitoxin system antitoxin component (TIGR02293 family)
MASAAIVTKQRERRVYSNRPATARVLEDASKPSSIIRQIKSGYPIAVFDHLKDDYGVNLQTLATITGISLPTIHRRKKGTGRLSAVESERVFRLQRLFAVALEVFEDRDFVRSWFTTPQRVFEGRTPLEYADTQPGAEEVEKALRRMEHGITL